MFGTLLNRILLPIYNKNIKLHINIIFINLSIYIDCKIRPLERCFQFQKTFLYIVCVCGREN